MYSRILVPLDGSYLAEQILPYVRVLALANGSEVVLLRVVGPVPDESADPAHGLFLDEVIERLCGEAGRYMQSTRDRLEKDGLKVRCVVKEGHAASCIISEATGDGQTLIAMSSHGRSGLGRWLVGSVTDKVLHASSNPLLIIRPRDGPGLTGSVKLETVIVPLDGSPLAEQVLPHVTDLAKALGLGVILVRATPSAVDFRRFMGYSGMRDYPDWDLGEAVDADAVNYLRTKSRQLRQQGVPNVQEVILHGQPAPAIIEKARSTPNNLVAITTHGRSGIERWVLGSVTDRVVLCSQDPVLIVRPAREGSEAASAA